MFAQAASALRPLRGVASSRGLATKRAGRARAKKNIDLGWDKLREPLEAAPLQLPSLSSLKIFHTRQGPGLAGARKFNKLMPALRWQNPDATIMQRWDDDNKSRAAVILELTDGQRSELDVSGQRSEEILGRVLQAAGAPEDDVASSVEWATGYLSSLEARARGLNALGVEPADDVQGFDDVDDWMAEGEHVEDDAPSDHEHVEQHVADKSRHAAAP